MCADTPAATARADNPFGVTSILDDPSHLTRQSNRAATWGAALALPLWPAGLVLSLVGLVRSAPRGGAGRDRAILGLLVSLAAALVTFTVLTTQSTASTAKDPGCRLSKPYLPSVSQIEGAPFASTGLPTFDSADAQALHNLQTLRSHLGRAASASTRSTVRNGIDAVNGDLEQEITALQAWSAGDGTQLTRLSTGTADQDRANLDTMCRVSASPEG